VNRVAVVLIVLLPLLPALGCLLQRALCRSLPWRKEYLNRGHPAAWVLVLLAASYALLIPGLVSALFSFSIYADILVGKIGLGPEGGMNRTGATTESMLGLVQLLFSTGSGLGAVLVVVYAIVIPAAKLVLLVCGELLRGRSPGASRTCVQVVQNISKWACPDMFAYVLLIHLIRGLNHPRLLRAAGRLDLGFTCFSLFCIGSTVAALGVQAPDREKRCWRAAAAMLGKRGLFAAVLPLTVAFFVLMGYGVQQPVMALRVRMESLYEPAGPIPSNFAPVIDMLHIPQLANADVSVVQCLKNLVQYIGYGEVNSFIGFIFLAGFVVACTMLDMLMLAVTAGFLAFGVVRTINGHSPLGLCWVLKKLSMLDVAIMGVIVVTLCMVMYRKDGVIVSMCGGLAQLAGAEAIHYLTYYLVKGAAQHFEPSLNFGLRPDEDESTSSGSGSEDQGSDSESCA